jgi:hypothetical protein
MEDKGEDKRGEMRFAQDKTQKVEKHLSHLSHLSPALYFSGMEQ